MRYALISDIHGNLPALTAVLADIDGRSDVVVRGDVPADIRRNMELWVGCIAGALEEKDYAAKLRAAGFADVEVDAWRVYNVEDARGFLSESGLDADAIAPQVKDRFASAFIRATKPASCCGPSCCK